MYAFFKRCSSFCTRLIWWTSSSLSIGYLLLAVPCSPDIGYYRCARFPLIAFYNTYSNRSENDLLWHLVSKTDHPQILLNQFSTSAIFATETYSSAIGFIRGPQTLSITFGVRSKSVCGGLYKMGDNGFETSIRKMLGPQ